ncbi:nuclear receptor coactivator 6 isoform X2 [Hemicordylus capensis]|uniref:nuclear receptor coactivator 6 isoform X2 n=1 Tax=Hemicordylus capensis TaxID=884348 RepID=UPI0023021846|nr:nuclear receptor coactivator 6 isoform X2 [Hemicordylus capensis]
MVWGDIPNLKVNYTSLCSSTMRDLEVDINSRLEEGVIKHTSSSEGSTIFVAFKGNIDDDDFKQKLGIILDNVPDLLHMDSDKLKLRKVEPWNSVRVTFNIPREAAERLRMLAQNNNQQLRDLGILSVQIEGEGAINLSLAPNRGQDVRINGPVGPGNSVRMETGFPMQGSQGLIRINNPATVMMQQSGSVSSSVISATNPELPPRTPRPASQSDPVDPLLSGLTIQQQNHPSGSVVPQLHSVQSVPVNRQINPANFQQMQPQLQPRPPQQHQQPQQGIRPSFTTPVQVPVPPGWNQVPSGTVQPPPSQGTVSTLPVNQGWKKAPLPGQMQQQLQARPSLATVQTPSHPPPPYPFGSQQASQAHTNFPQMNNSGQFTAPQMKNLQGGPSRVPTPLQQPHLTNKSPASSPSSFQQGSPASSPTVNQAQQQMGPRPPQNNTLPQGFQQPVNSPGRNPMVQQGNVPPNFMVMQQQNQGPQGLHPGLGGMPKRLPPGFPPGQANQNFMQSQVPSTAPGTPANSGTPQLQTSQSVQHTGGQGNGPPQNQMQIQHGPPNMMQTNLMGLHGNINNQQTGNSGVPQVNMGNMQPQPPQGPQSQLMGMHQQIVSSQGQMVNIQPQGSLNAQNQMILSRAQLLPQGQMMVAPQNQNLGPSQQRITPPKQMIPQQGQQMMAAHNQMMGPQGQVLLQQNSMMDQMMTNQMQGNKQPFNSQSQSNVMTGPAQIMRGPTPNMQGNMTPFPGQMITQQGPVNGNSQVMGIQGQVLRPTGPNTHMSQQLGDTTTTTNSDLTQMLPDVSMQQGNMVPPHLQGLQGNSNTSGSHFAGHGMPFSAPFSGGQNGNQISCGQNPGFPINKDVTLTSPLLVNLLQSDISAGHFGVNSKPNNQNTNKPKKKKPPRKKKNNQQAEQINASEPRTAGLEEADQLPLPGEQGINLDNTGHKLPDFTNRPPGYPSQSMEQRSLQQMPPQLLQHGGQQQPPPTPQQTQSQQQQQMMMMLMMQQDPKSVRLPVTQGVHQPRGPLNVETQRIPMQQGGNMSVMVSLQGPGSVPPSPDKQRASMPNNPPLVNSARKMVYQDNAQNPTNSPLGEVPSMPSVLEGNGSEAPPASGVQNNIASHLVVSQNQLMMAGPKPGPSPMSAPQGASPQQQSNSLPGPHPHHFQSVATTSQTSRPKTPNRASPRPYYPQTPNNRPPSTEPSEISLSPERLNASIAGLFPPQINIPLPPRPNLNRGFDQQGLNPTTLKAIGQAPSNLTMNSQSSFVSPQTHKLDSLAINSGKQTNAGGAKRASPSNSRRSSPGSSRKTTPSPGRQNSKAAKLALTPQQNSALMQNMDLQRSMMVGPPSLQTPMPGSFQNNGMLSAQNPAIPVSIMTGIPEDKESFSAPQDSTCQNTQGVAMNKDQRNIELKGVPSQEIKILVHEEQQKREAPLVDSNKLPSLEESKTLLSPAMREAPTSLSQLLDHSGAPNVTIKPLGLSGLDVPPAVTCAEEFKKISAIPPSQQDPSSSKDPACSLSLSQSTEVCSTPVQQDLGDSHSNVSQNIPPVIQRPVSSASISTSLPPSQITVFVTSNPITSSSNTSASLPSHLQPTLMPTVVTMPNVSNKVMTSEGQTVVQSSARPQFITPVFINSSSIIQVMKGSQPSTVPATPMTSSSNLMPQSVAVVGPLHLSQNIKFSSGPAPPSASSNTPVSSMPTSRSLVINSLATPIQLPSPSSTASSSTSLHPSIQQVKDFNPEEKSSQTCASTDPCSVATTQSGAVVSPPRAHSPGSSVNRRSPVSSTKGKGKVDRIGQFLLTKACMKVTDSLEKGEEQYSIEGEVEDQGQEISIPNSVEAEQLPVDLKDNTMAPPASTLSKQSTSGTSHLNVSTAATVSASVSLSLPSSTSSTNVLSVVTTPVISDIISTIPSTNGNPGSLPAEPVGIGPDDEKAEVHHELPQNMGSSAQTPVATQESAVQRTELEANSATITGLTEPKESCEKSKTPSRRNSRTEESSAVQETVENGQRKRSSRPASASSTAKETNASAMQSKRRKSK